ncbi:MAG: hypothetical protein JWM59_1959 [Verrucomicrobiales bacterium]|nr:hypothetical protein [Verrucomicrobiales bacterium]
MTTICIIADTHRQHRELVIPPCDLLIHCGDMCSFQQDDMGTLEDIDCWFAEVPARRVVCIGGNHDFELQSREFRFAHADYLCDRLIEVEGLKIYGAPWIPDLSGFAFYLPEKALAEKWSRIPAGIDILITTRRHRAFWTCHHPATEIWDVPICGVNWKGSSPGCMSLGTSMPAMAHGWNGASGFTMPQWREAGTFTSPTRPLCTNFWGNHFSSGLLHCTIGIRRSAIPCSHF